MSPSAERWQKIANIFLEKYRNDQIRQDRVVRGSGKYHTPWKALHTRGSHPYVYSQAKPIIDQGRAYAVVTSPMSHMRARKGAGGAPGWDVLPWKAIEPPLEVRPKYIATPNSFEMRAGGNGQAKQPQQRSSRTDSVSSFPCLPSSFPS